jgi:hypothetical protein
LAHTVVRKLVLTEEILYRPNYNRQTMRGYTE